MDVADVIVVPSFTTAIWLIAKGHTPLRAVFNPQRGSVEFLFSAAAQQDWAAFYIAKDQLDQLSRRAKAVRA